MRRRLATRPPDRSAVLVVSPFKHDHQALQTILARLHWRLNSVAAAAKAHSWMEARGTPAVLICDRDLPDGTWRELFEKTEALPPPPEFIVASRLADDSLWAEVLNMGGYDVLAIPFEAGEVSRIVLHANDFWHRKWDEPIMRRQAAGAGCELYPPRTGT